MCYPLGMNSPKDHAQAALQASALSPGERYRHYKGGEYEIVTCAVQEDTLAVVVVYRSIHQGYVWVRTLTNFNEEVDTNGQRVKRFEKIP